MIMPLTAEQQAEIDKALEKEQEDIIADINDLDDDSVDPPEDPPANPPEGEDPPVEDSPENPPVSDDPPADPNPEPDPEPEPTDDIEELRKLINQQNAEILALKSNQPSKPPEVKEKEPTEPKPPVETPPEPPESGEYKAVDYVGDLDMDDVTADKNILNNIINNAVQNAISHIQSMIPDVNAVTSSIPETVKVQVAQQNYIDRVVGEFYNTNEDLNPVKETVSQVAQNIAAEHPDYDLPKLFNEAAKLTRTLLRMPEPVVKPPEEDKGEFNKPAFAGRTSRRQTPAKTQSLVDEINEL
jgi:hypothetical protein